MTGWKDIKSALEKLKSTESTKRIEDVRKLFIEKSNFDYADKGLDEIDFSPQIKDKIIQTKIIASKGDFKIILCKIDALLKGIERPAVQTISRYYLNNLIVFTDKKETEFHFINTRYIGKDKEKKARGFRRITVGKTDRLRTAAERLSMIYAPEGISSLDLQTKCEEAFNVEAVTEEFYKIFVEKYKDLRKTILEENDVDKEKADELTQNILNRLLFLYFIQKKEWLKEDYKFLYNNFLNLNHNSEKNYYRDFLLPLFKKLSRPDFHHPDFEDIPFLNGGLFKFDQIEERIKISNRIFEEIFNDLLERFNFTIREDNEYEQEVAIDPEMLGKIFENLVLAVESEKYKDIPDVRRASGSYYTPRFIVTFMARESLLEYLVSELPLIERRKIKSLIFDEEPKLDDIDKDNLKIIKEKLLDLKIVDPGVGSGAFAVDILNRVVNFVEKINNAIGEATSRYKLRKNLIENSIYGVDTQKRAIHLAHLRLWLSLVVDTKDTKDTKDILPLINLDFRILKGNSLKSKIFGYPFDMNKVNTAGRKTSEGIINTIEKFKNLKIEYAEAFEESKRKKLKEEIKRKKAEIAIWYLTQIKRKKEQELSGAEEQLELFKKPEQLGLFKKTEQQREAIKREIENINAKISKIKDGKEEIDSFNWWLDFFEVIGIKGGFDIVIGNPPYGINEPQEVAKGEFGLGSNDSYGVFTALGAKILKPGGVLCFIMSDTYQTIRTHRKLRGKLLKECEIKYLISVPSRTFRATVNPGIYLFKKNLIDREKNDFVLAADFHNLNIKNGDLEAGFELLVEKDVFDETKDGYTITSEKEMTIYAYRQKIIKRFSNLSFFIASPKLFKLMDDTTNVSILKEPPVIKVDFNDKEIELVKLGDIAEVKQGLATGDNHYYLCQLPGTKGSNYKEIDLRLILTDKDLKRIRDDEKLRKETIEKGICKDKPDKVAAGFSRLRGKRYFGGKYFVPYDKGGASDIEEGWLPNYYVPTPYFIDWSEEAVRRMKTLTIANRLKIEGKTIPSNRQYYKKQIAAVLRNKDFYFKEGISFSDTGYYAPTYRKCSATLFDVMGMSIFSFYLQNKALLGIISSKLSRYFIKVFINHSVHSQVEGAKKIPVIHNAPKFTLQKLTSLVSSIITKQKQNPRYDYMINEQIEIDKIIYKLYNLNDEDIEEVENWYYRRYPKLAQVIEKKLNREGKRETRITEKDITEERK